MRKFTIAIVAMLAGVLLIVGSFAANWFFFAADKAAPENVQQQHTEVIDSFNGIINAADNACAIQGSSADDSDRDPTLVENPDAAYVSTFNNAVQSYNDKVDNLFRAGIVRPAGYPDHISTSELDTTDWCTVSSQVQDLKN